MKPFVRHKLFIKHYKQRILPYRSLDKRFEQRLLLFCSGERGEPINDHALRGDKKGRRSFSITGDIRVIYRETSTEYELLDIGTHSQVY